jgi:hypothetical protein
VSKDGLGLIVIEPHCDGACAVELEWDAGWEPRIAVAVAVLALAFAAVWIAREHRHKPRV